MYFGAFVLLKEAGRLAVLLISIFLAVVLVSDFVASLSLVRISVALGLSSFVESLAMVSRIQGVKVDRLMKMPANSMSIPKGDHLPLISEHFPRLIYVLFIDCRESHLRTFCRQVHQCVRIGG